MSVKAIIFDCDGVLLESAGIKTEAFRALFRRESPRKVNEIVGYHLGHMGVSRHVKFKHICTKILSERYTMRRQKQLAAAFKRFAYAKVLRCPMVKGARRFLQSHSGIRSLYVASGTPHAELNDILKRRCLSRHFKRVWGAPTKKTEAIRQVLRRGRFRKKEVIFVGDAETDWRAAKKSGIAFVRRVDSSVVWTPPPCRWQIEDLDGLPAVLRDAERAQQLKKTKK